jgi:hypothetical protein
VQYPKYLLSPFRWLPVVPKRQQVGIIKELNHFDRFFQTASKLLDLFAGGKGSSHRVRGKVAGLRIGLAETI